MTPSRFNLSPEWGLVMVTALWGSSFILLSLSLKGLSPGLLVALRFGGGAVLMACLLRSALFKLKKVDWDCWLRHGNVYFSGLLPADGGPADDYEFDFGLSDGALRAVCTAFPMDYL